MDNRIKQGLEFEEAKRFLSNNGKVEITGIISKNLEEYKIVFIPNTGEKIELIGSDSMELIIGLYRELN
ncbi:MAG: hypothetical protein GYA14_07545 [Ignavibacteria bacterium]|nr:hypothetical protein [Ignavibacteria bacterium]